MAAPVIVLSQLPPAGEASSVVVADAQVVDGPVITGNAFTVITLVTVPHRLLYCMVAVPAATPVTVVVPPPPVVTVATEGDRLDHVPPVKASDNVIAAETHTAFAPDIADGAVFTVSVVAAGDE